MSFSLDNSMELVPQENEAPWYPKCIIIHGTLIEDQNIISFVDHFFPKKYLTNDQLIDKFYDDLSVGIFDKNNYELRRYKTNTFPAQENYYFIMNRILIDISAIGNISIILNDPEISEIKNFKKCIQRFGLDYKKYLIITG